ncbi:MAG: PPOX class F420-dependent oxidoreductase, partial [Roseiflexaceae bacterium]
MAFDALANQEFMNLITQRKSGADVATPVWFAQDGDRLYVMTGRTAGKVKRIRNNPRVQVAPSDRAGTPLGP